jgi:hypothetical protein
MINQSNTSFSIFQEPWWLDAVTNKKWSEINITDKENNIIARLPYYEIIENKRIVLKIPPLTQHLGPWLTINSEKNSTYYSKEIELLTRLINKLPNFDIFWQKFHYKITNWLPFYWNGFSQTTRYTYIINDLDDLDKVWFFLEKDLRNLIRKAEKNLHVKTDLKIEELIKLNEMTFQRQGLGVPYPKEILYNIFEACTFKNAGKIFFAVDHFNNIHASILIVWDKESAYYLIAGSDPSLRKSNAIPLLIWEAIKFSANLKLKRFDFEGSMIKSVESFLRGFGAILTPYFQIRKEIIK